MITFLQQTWQLWFWAMFCPTKLRQRISTETSGEAKDFGYLFNTDISFRFLFQFLLLLLLSSLPLITGVYMSGQFFDWLIVVIVWFMAFIISGLYLPLGINVPLFFGMFYLIQPEFLRGIFVTPAVISMFAPSSFIQSWTVLFSGLIITAIISRWLSFHTSTYRDKWYILVSSVGSTLSVIYAGWISNQDWPDILLLGLLTTFWGAVFVGFWYKAILPEGVAQKIFAGIDINIGFFVGFMGLSISGVGYFLTDIFTVNYYEDGLVIGWIVAFLLIGFVSFGVLGFIGGIVGIYIVTAVVTLTLLAAIAGAPVLLVLGIVALPLPFLLLSAWALGFCFSPSKQIGWALGLMGVLLPLALGSQGWLALLVVPALLVGYYRLLPDYPILALLSTIQSLRPPPLDAHALRRRLYCLPPYNGYELFLRPLPLPGYKSLLCAYFTSAPDSIADVLQESDSQPPWFQKTTSEALLSIVDNELRDYLRNLATVKTLQDLIIKGRARRSAVLQLLAEKFPPDKRIGGWESDALRHLDAIVNNIATELKSDSYRAREELVQTSLEELNAIKSNMYVWKDIKKQWQPLLQTELNLVKARLAVEELSQIKTFDDLTAIAAIEHPVFSNLLPALSRTEQSDNDQAPSVLDHDPALAEFFPQLQQIALDAQKAHQLKPASQAEDALNQVLKDVRSAQQQASRLEPDTARRWQPVFDRWYQIVQAEIPVIQARIVVEQLQAVSTIEELIAVARDDHPVLPLLIPAYYRNRADNYDPSVVDSMPVLPDPALPVLFPELLTIARDVGASGEAGTAALRERNLERCLLHLLGLRRRLSQYELDAQTLGCWQPIIEQWQPIIETAIEQQQSLSTGEVMNPFQAGNPIPLQRHYLFKGRRKFSDYIVRQLLDDNRPTIVLHGPRRCGKSSFLNNLPGLIPTSGVLPVYIDIQQGAATSSDADFCFTLARGMHRDLRGRGIQLPRIERNAFPVDPYPVFEDWLDQAEVVFEGQRILLCLDEFEKLGTAITEGRISLRIFDELRHLIQHHDQLGFLFCGAQTPDQLGPNWSSYFISAQLIEMTYLDPDEAEQVLTDPAPGFELRYESGVVEQILSITRCQPFLVQLIGTELVNQANEAQTKLITQPLLNAALASALSAGTAYFDNLWHQYTGTTPAEVQVGQSLLMALAKEQPLPPLDTEPARKALQWLLRYHTIELVDGDYRFEVPLVKRWVRERAQRDY